MDISLFDELPRYRLLEIMEPALINLVLDLAKETGEHEPIVGLTLNPDLYDRLADELLERSRRRRLDGAYEPYKVIVVQTHGGAIRINKGVTA